jgi:hypothetical protein
VQEEHAMTEEEERRDAQVEALICIVGSILAVLDVKSDAADLWPETMRKGTPDEIQQVTAELADVLPVSLFRNLRVSEGVSDERSPERFRGTVP